MTIETIDISDISQDPANVRKHSRRNLDAIKASLRAFGQQKPIVVDDRNVILAGNGTYEAAKELGWSEIQIVRTRLTGTSAVAYAIADNRTAELAEWDDTALAEQLRALQSEEFDVEAAGFTGEEIDQMIEKIGSNLINTLGETSPINEVEGYEDRNIKQVILLYSADQFPLIVSAIADYSEKYGLSNNSEAIAHMIEHNGYSVQVPE